MRAVCGSLCGLFPLMSFVKRHASQGLRFVIVGSLGAIVDLGSLHLLVTSGGLSPYIAQFGSTAMSVSVVFTLNKFFTFKSRAGRTAGQAARFAFVYGIAIVSNLLLTSLFLYLGFHHLIAKCFAIGMGILWNYSMSHAFVFKKQDKEILEEAAVV